VLDITNVAQQRVKNHNLSGFTIVELLIVVVVIGILAAIVIVAYNGVQSRARNSQSASIVQAYKKALLEYAIEKGVYPIDNATACLGEDYPDLGAFTVAAGHVCFRSSSSSGMNNTTFNTAIRPYMGNTGKLPTPNNTILGDGAGAIPYFRGALFHTNSPVTIDGVANKWILIYSQEGATKCPVGPVLDVTQPGYPALTSTPPASGYSYSVTGGTAGVECWLPMPDPAKV
jgi:prepilin-type N-terminal cleavage/methylation domain-containing protein